MQVVVDSLLTTYEVRGKGKLVVLLHGWGDSASGLRDLQVALAKHYQVLALDLPGFGGTEPPKHAWGLHEYAQFIAHFLHKIDSKPVYVLVGHSNGGAIAMRGLAQNVLTADRLVLMATAGIRGVHKGKVRAIRFITKAGKVLAMPLPKSVKQKLRKKVYQAAGSDMLVAEHLQETFKKVVNDDVRDDAAKVGIPTLLIYGESDQATPVWYGQAFHELIPGSTLEVLPGAGHFVHKDRPDDVVRAIVDFAA